MNAAALKMAARYAGRWSAIVFFVLLLTLIFSFLGTIICAVLAGMMFGATKHVRWQALLISLIFPGAIFGLLRAGRAPLLENQVLVLSLLCFGAFWLTYATAAAVICFERSSANGTPTASEQKTMLAADYPAPTPQTTVQSLKLSELQGTWSRPPSGRNGESRAKELEINAEEVVLRVRDSHGHISTLGKAKVRLDDASRTKGSSFACPVDDSLVCI